MSINTGMNIYIAANGNFQTFDSLNIESISIQLTYDITDAPTDTPTKPPSKSPSFNPTKSPSFNPSKTPSRNPSKSPSKSSQNPSKSPSFNPTITPTQNPSNVPTVTPTKSTFHPTNTPTITPTDITSLPSYSPSNIPTNSPTKPQSIVHDVITTTIDSVDDINWDKSDIFTDDNLYIMLVSIGALMVIISILIIIIILKRRNIINRSSTKIVERVVSNSENPKSVDIVEMIAKGDHSHNDELETILAYNENKMDDDEEGDNNRDTEDMYIEPKAIQTLGSDTYHGFIGSQNE